MSPIHFYKDYMVERYGMPLFRIPVDTGRGCPHRGFDGTGGCTFCPEDGARAVQNGNCSSIFEQIDSAIQFSRERYGAKRFMLYFQAFSATREFDEQTGLLYRELLHRNSFDAVSIGTRPDCLGPKVLAFLKELQQETDVWVELGIQTVHDETLQRINRGHDWACSLKAIETLNQIGIPIIAHVILGLPGEEQDHFHATASALAELPVSAIKMHNLHVIRNTVLEEQYRLTPFKTYDEYEYAEILMQFLRRIPREWPVVRMVTDTPDEMLIAPRWHMSKGRFVHYVEQQMICREWKQGDLVAGKDGMCKPMASPYDRVVTDDGSVTFWNGDYKEHYHTPVGAKFEAVEKYVVPSELSKRLDSDDVHLLDICFGLGYNTLAACDVAKRLKRHHLQVTALEMDRRVVGQASKDIDELEDGCFSARTVLEKLYREECLEKDSFSIRILWGDARFRMRHIQPKSIDVVFLDAFSTQRNSECWSPDFFRLIRSVMKPDGVMLTYCAALPVRSGLVQAGFFVGETKAAGRHRCGTLASLNPELIKQPLNQKEAQTIKNTPRGFPYRDPFLCWTNSEILRMRQQRVVRAKQRLKKL